MAGLFAVLIAAYWPVLQAGFCPWDDSLYTAENPLVQNGLSVQAAWQSLTSSWENNWSPVFWIFLAGQVSLGAGVHPGVFHAVSLGLSLLNAGLLLLTLRRFGVSFAAALVATAFFALHPLRVETVGWISAQKHLLAAALLLGSLIFYRDFQNSNSRTFLALSLSLFAGSLMSSQIGVGLPVFLFFWEACESNSIFGQSKRAALRSGGYFFLGIAAAAATLWVNWNPSAQAVAWYDHALSHRILQALGALGWQLAALLGPWNLATFYPWPERQIYGYATLGLLVAAASLAFLMKNRAGLMSAGVSGFFACFLPVSGLLAIPITFTADRLSYVPALFLTLTLGATLDAGLRRRWRWPLYALGGVSLALAPLTFLQARHWKDERTIVSRTLALYPDSIPAQINEAAIWGMEGRSEEALARFQKIRAQEPLHEVVWSNEIALLKKLGRQEEALATGREAVRQIPKSIPLNYQMGLELAEQNRPAEALEYFRRARTLSPASVQPTYQCARMLVQLGEVKEALSLLKLLELSLRGDPQYWTLRAEAHDRNGDWEAANRSREAAGLLQRTKAAP